MHLYYINKQNINIQINDECYDDFVRVFCNREVERLYEY